MILFQLKLIKKLKHYKATLKKSQLKKIFTKTNIELRKKIKIALELLKKQAILF